MGSPIPSTASDFEKSDFAILVTNGPGAQLKCEDILLWSTACVFAEKNRFEAKRIERWRKEGGESQYRMDTVAMFLFIN